MARIVFAWELGGDYGHLARLLPLAIELKRRGHAPMFVARDLGGAELLIGPHGMPWFQAPLWVGQVKNLPDPAGYAELLMRVGFLSPQALTGIVRAWRNLLTELRSDMVVMDHAPTALLATRGLSLRRVIFGDGFCIPPHLDPLPLFHWWKPSNLARQADSEERVRQSANEVLFKLGAPPIAALRELFSADADIMCTFATLDHYEGRAPVQFAGPLFKLSQGVPATWPDGEGPRVFAYLKAGYSSLDKVLAVLRDLPMRVLAHVPGASRDTLRRFSAATMRFSEAPIDMEAARAACDLAICHGGQGTVAAMLLAGKPMLLLPMQAEQAMTAHRLDGMGVALTATPDGAAQVGRLIKRLLAEPGFGQAARTFAAAHAGYDQAEAVADMAARCEALLAGA